MDDMDERQRSECFGLPHGNLIGPIIAGIILILIGLSFFVGWNFWYYIWPIVIIIIGILIIVGAIFSRRR